MMTMQAIDTPTNDGQHRTEIERWLKSAARVLGEIKARRSSCTRPADAFSVIGELESLSTLLMWALAWQLVDDHDMSHPAEILSRRVGISMAKAIGMLDDAAALSKMPGLLPMFEEGRVSPNQVLVLVEVHRMLSRDLPSHSPTTARLHMSLTAHDENRRNDRTYRQDFPDSPTF